MTTPASPQPVSLVDSLDVSIEAAFREQDARQGIVAPPAPGEPGNQGPEAPPVSETPDLTEDFSIEGLLSPEDTVTVVPDETPTEEEEIEIPEEVKGQGEKAVETWGTLKRSERAARTEAATLRKEVETLKAKVGAPEDSEATAKRVAELEARVAEQEKFLAAHDVIQSTEFQEAVITPLARIEQIIDDIADDKEHADRIIKAMMIPNVKARGIALGEVVEDMPEVTRHKVYALVDKMDEIKAKEAIIREKSLQAKSEIDKNRLAQKGVETEKDKQARLAATDIVFKNLTKKIPELADAEGNPTPELIAIHKKVRETSIVDAGLATQAFAPFAVELVPVLVKQAKAQAAEIAKLNAAITDLTGASPRPGGGGLPKGNSGPSDGKSFLDAIEDQINSGKVVF